MRFAEVVAIIFNKVKSESFIKIKIKVFYIIISIRYILQEFQKLLLYRIIPHRGNFNEITLT